MSLKPLTGGAAPDEDNGKKWDRKFSEDPLVPIGCGITAAVLIGGLRSFAQGNSAKSQMYMRARVFAQASTVTVLAAAAMGRPMSGAALTSSLSSGERSPRKSRSSFDDRSLRPQGEEARRGSSFADQAREESLSRLNRARSRQQGAVTQ